MTFKLLFDHQIITQWKEEYFTYDLCNEKIQKLYKIIIDLNKKQVKLKKAKTKILQEYFKLKIERIKTKIEEEINFLKEEKENKIQTMITFFNEKHECLLNDYRIIKNILVNSEVTEEEELNLNLNNLHILRVEKIQKNQIIKFSNNALKNIFELATWLRNFCIMNGLAFDKLLTKCRKKLTDEYYDRLASDHADRQKFLFEYVDMVENLREEVVKLFAKYFYKGDVIKGLENIKAVTPVAIFSDIIIIVMLVIIFLIFVTYFLITYLKGNDSKIDKIGLIDTYFHAFSFSIMIFLMLLGLAIDIVVLRHYKINYCYLLKIDPHINLKRVFSLLIIWGLVLLSYRICISYFYESTNQYLYIFSLIILIFTFVYIFWPFKSFLYDFRVHFIKLLFKILFPFGANKVSFDLIIFSGIFSSFSRAYLVFTISICVLSCKKCRETNNVLDCERISIYFYIVQVIPYLLRAILSFNIVYYKKQMWPHLVNGFRLLTSAVTVTFAFLYAASKILFYFILFYLEYLNIYYYISFAVISYFYNIWYTFFVSWKLLQWNSKNFLLRDKIVFPKWFYYFALVTTLILMGAWSLRFILVTITKSFLFFILIILSVYTRTQFIILRVENEFFNNPEKFRKFVPVPDPPEEAQLESIKIEVNK